MMRIDNLLSERVMDKSTDIIIEMWVQPIEQQKAILADNGMPNLAPIQWESTANDRDQ